MLDRNGKYLELQEDLLYSCQDLCNCTTYRYFWLYHCSLTQGTFSHRMADSHWNTVFCLLYIMLHLSVYCCHVTKMVETLDCSTFSGCLWCIIFCTADSFWGHNRPPVVPFCTAVACVTVSAYWKATVNVFCVNVDGVWEGDGIVQSIYWLCCGLHDWALNSAVNILTVLWVAWLGFE